MDSALFDQLVIARNTTHILHKLHRWQGLEPFTNTDFLYLIPPCASRLPLHVLQNNVAYATVAGDPLRNIFM